MWETQVRSLGWEDLLEKEMATNSSVLAWRIPGSGEPGGLPSMELHRVGHDLKRLSSSRIAAPALPQGRRQKEVPGSLSPLRVTDHTLASDWGDSLPSRVLFWRVRLHLPALRLLEMCFCLLLPIPSPQPLSHYCSVAKSCPTLCYPMAYSIPGFPVLQYLPEFAQIHVHWIGDAV